MALLYSKKQGLASIDQSGINLTYSVYSGMFIMPQNNPNKAHCMKKLFPLRIRTGFNGAAVVFLKQLLISTGYLPPDTEITDLYDDVVSSAVRKLQLEFPTSVEASGDFEVNTHEIWRLKYHTDLLIIPLAPDQTETMFRER